MTSPVWPAEKKLLVWSKSAPDFPSGSPAILAELLRHAPPGHVRVVAEDSPLRRQMDIAYPIRRLNIRRMSWPFPRGARVIPWARLLAAFPMTAIGLREVLSFQPSAILTIYFDDAWMISSLLVSLITGTPLIVYVHDPYLENVRASSSMRLKLMKPVEKSIMRQAQILTLYESLSRHYHELYQVSPSVIPHLVTKKRLSWTPPGGKPPLVIGFAGSIYANNLRQMKDLAGICGNNENIHLRIFTPTKKEELLKAGISGERISVMFADNQDKLLAELNKCHLLYLPLDSEGGEGLTRLNLKVVLPTKAVDYLLAGPPALVHAPSDYEVFRFFQTTGSALLLDADSSETLEQRLNRYLDSGIPGIPEHHLLAALDHFSSGKVLEKFFTVLRNASPSPRHSIRSSLTRSHAT
ncbi:MAG: hypothetical protein GMKNLPBB_03116 [Myxococcota bacterium]|nr:hypothetical protein [Myxococcota bacterium]